MENLKTENDRMRQLLQSGVLLVDELLHDRRDVAERLERWTAAVANLDRPTPFVTVEIDHDGRRWRLTLDQSDHMLTLDRFDGGRWTAACSGRWEHDTIVDMPSPGIADGDECERLMEALERALRAELGR
jgi:hypothetical protein